MRQINVSSLAEYASMALMAGRASRSLSAFRQNEPVSDLHLGRLRRARSYVERLLTGLDQEQQSANVLRVVGLRELSAIRSYRTVAELLRRSASGTPPKSVLENTLSTLDQVISSGGEPAVSSEQVDRAEAFFRMLARHAREEQAGLLRTARPVSI